MIEKECGSGVMRFYFDPQKDYTYRETLEPAMKIQTQEEADQYLEAYIDWHSEKFDHSRAKAEMIAKINLGYYAGYYDDETMARVNRLFCTEHPVFGEVADAN